MQKGFILDCDLTTDLPLMFYQRFNVQTCRQFGYHISNTKALFKISERWFELPSLAAEIEIQVTLVV